MPPILNRQNFLFTFFLTVISQYIFIYFFVFHCFSFFCVLFILICLFITVVTVLFISTGFSARPPSASLSLFPRAPPKVILPFYLHIFTQYYSTYLYLSIVPPEHRFSVSAPLLGFFNLLWGALPPPLRHSLDICLHLEFALLSLQFTP